jgi:Lysylphosphatidylglycerol synthase TM region
VTHDWRPGAQTTRTGHPVRRGRPLTIVGALTTAAGVLLLVWVIVAVGSAEIWSGLRQIGWGLLVIVALGGLRFGARAIAWTMCLDPPHRLPFGDALGAVIAGDALGNVIPLGPLVSEPTKAAFVRARVPLMPALTALAIENVLYTLSVAAMIAAGLIALLFRFELPAELRGFSVIAIGAISALFAFALWLSWRQPAVLSRVLGAVLRSSAAQNDDEIRNEARDAKRRLSRIDRARAVEEQIYTFVGRRGVAIVPVVGAELTFHALGVLEAHVTLWMLQGTPPTLTTSFILETVNRLITVVFKFIPLQIGVNEAGTALLTQVLGLGALPGTTVGIVRRLRMLCWTLAGTALFFKRGLTTRRVLEDAELSASGKA